MRKTALAALLGLMLSAPAAVGAESPSVTLSDLVQTPLERAAFTTLPALYRVTYTVRVVSLDDVGTSYPIDEDVAVSGIAFGIAPGQAATARGIVNPSNARLVGLALAKRPPRTTPPDVSRLRARVAAAGRITLARASPAPEQVTTLPKTLTATILKQSSADQDVAVLATNDKAAPTVALVSDLSADTPVAAVAFDPVTGQPIARIATLLGRAQSSTTGSDRFGITTVDLSIDEYGAPLIDDDGNVRGLAIRRRAQDGSPAVASAGAVRALIDDQPDAKPSASLATFRQGMDAFWRRDYAVAAATFTGLSGTFGSFPSAEYEASRARDLAGAEYVISGATGLRGMILAVGAMSTIAAAIFGAMLLRRRPLT